MNVLLTRACNRRCSYCFAMERMNGDAGASGRHDAPLTISKDDFARVVEFAVRSGQGGLGILGGEPSLHPEFLDLLAVSCEAGLRTTVFTNALWSKAKLGRVVELRRRYDELLNFIVNMNEPSRSPAHEHARQARLFQAVPEACCLGFNASRTDCDARFLVDVVETYGLQKEIRIGLAQPLADTPNEHVAAADYRGLAPAVMALAEECDRNDIRLGFDCGFVLCMFSEEQVGRLVLAGAHFTSFCGPAIDVGTDLSVWACFPLSTFATCPGRW